MRHPIGYAATCGAVAGVIGGIAEVGWIWFYAALTGSDAGIVARGVASAIGFDSRLLSPVASGIVIHMALAAALGVVLAIVLQPLGDVLRGVREFVAVTTALVAVWMVNFFVILPLISPEFVEIVPLGVSLASKLLFGVAAAGCFHLVKSARLSAIQV